MSRFEPRCVFPEWMLKLTMQQQSVLVLAARGPDGVEKYHPCKEVVKAYRGFVLKSARLGRRLRFGEGLDTFGSLIVFPTHEWDKAMSDYFNNVDSIPHHYHLHLLHGAEILGYKHTEILVRGRWLDFYQRGCSDMHMEPETEIALDKRLGDWNQIGWNEE
jgi:hypothetical protein